MVIAGLPTQAARISEARDLMQWGFDAWEARPLFAKGRIVADIPVQLGSRSWISVAAPRDLGATLAKGAGEKFTLRIRYKGPVKAPLKKGAEIAQLLVKFSDGRQQVMPLVSTHSVETAGFWGRTWNGLKSVVGA